MHSRQKVSPQGMVTGSLRSSTHRGQKASGGKGKLDSAMMALRLIRINSVSENYFSQPGPQSIDMTKSAS